MKKLVRALDIAAFLCSVAAALVLLLHLLGLEIPAIGPGGFNRAMSNLVAGYACLYGLSQWIQRKNGTLAAGLMIIGTLILAVNSITAS